MGNWVMDQFLQKVPQSEWNKFTDADLEYIKDARLDYPEEFRKRVRVEIRARRQGKNLPCENGSCNRRNMNGGCNVPGCKEPACL